MLNPPISRMGGKSKLRKTIIEMIPEHTFFFADPPYYETAGYENKFGEKEHLMLLDYLKNIKGKFLLTINDNEKVREWYKDFNIKEVEVNYSVSREQKARGKYKELIITNYEVKDE